MRSPCRTQNFGTVVTNLTYDKNTLTGLGQAELQLGILGGRAAGAGAAHLGRPQLLPSLVRELRLRSTISRWDRTTSIAFTIHGAEGSAAAGRWRLPGPGIRHQAGEVRRAGAAVRDALAQVREAAGLLGRLRRHRERAAAPGTVLPGRLQHRVAAWKTTATSSRRWTIQARCTATASSRCSRS